MKAIETRQDAENFIAGCLIWIGAGFHPDTPMSEYVDEAGNPTFDATQAQRNQSKLDDCFLLLGDEIYTVGMHWMQRLGYAPNDGYSIYERH